MSKPLEVREGDILRLQYHPAGKYYVGGVIGVEHRTMLIYTMRDANGNTHTLECVNGVPNNVFRAEAIYRKD